MSLAWQAAVLAGAFLLAPANASAARVHVEAATRLEGRLDRDPSAPSGVVIRGTLRDDVGHPLPDSHVAITFHGTPSDSPALMLPSPRRCTEPAAVGARDPHFAPDEYVVDTDALGSFCIRTALPVERGAVKLSFRGSSVYDGTSAEIAFDLARASVTLAFNPEPAIVSLDRASYSVGLRVTAPGIRKDHWRVTLRDEKKRPLGGAEVDPDGLVRIDVPTEHLASPGPGELSATLEGAPITAPTISHPIERHARVDLELANPEPRGSPEDGIPIEVRAHSAGGPVNVGSIEATIDDHSVGAAPIRAGRATIVPTFASTRGISVTASIRYLPDAPWWEPGPNLNVSLHLNAPSAWRRAGPILLALAVAAWMLRGSWLPHFLRAPSRPRVSPRPTARPALRIIGERPSGEGWEGRVLDAHDGEPLKGAHVSIVVPSFPGGDGRSNEATVDATTDDAGCFVLAFDNGGAGPILRVRAPWHTPFEQPLPPPCELSIAMVSRRRHLLDRLVEWAAREWGPGQGVREPTPAEVASRARRAARESQEPEAAREVEVWARAVEGTAFGRADVDESAENAVVDLEPAKARARRDDSIS